MASLGQTLNLQDLPEDSYAPRPAGDYEVMITDSAMEQTADKTGQFIKLEYSIQNGQYAGGKFYDRLNVVNKSEKAQEIAYSTLRKIMEAVGVNSISDTEQLHNKRMIITVAVQEGKPYQDKTTGETKQGNPQNAIKAYKPYAAAQSTANGTVAAATSSAKPWAKK